MPASLHAVKPGLSEIDGSSLLRRVRAGNRQWIGFHQRSRRFSTELDSRGRTRSLAVVLIGQHGSVANRDWDNCL